MPIAPLVNAVNVAQEVERIANRHVPPELHPLPEHCAEAAHMRLPLRPRRVPIHRAAAARRRQDARHQLDQGALARAIRSNQPDEFPAPNAEGYVPERLHLACFPPPQARDAAILRFLPPDVCLCQPVCHDERRIYPLLFHALPPLDARTSIFLPTPKKQRRPAAFFFAGIGQRCSLFWQMSCFFAHRECHYIIGSLFCQYPIWEKSPHQLVHHDGGGDRGIQALRRAWAGEPGASRSAALVRSRRCPRCR